MEASLLGIKPSGKLASKEKAGNKPVKCVVWDLDNTIWDGVLLEDVNVSLRPGVVTVIKALDERGILQSIASRNDYARAEAKLRELELLEYFLYPQINWESKSESLKNIAQLINIGLDSVVLIDDQPYERDEVRFSLPEVRPFDAVEANDLLAHPDFNPRFITEDSKNRRRLYLDDHARQQAEKGFSGTQTGFLATLQMAMTIAKAQAEDLRRAEELTIRTNQLNTTGIPYSYDELDRFRNSDRHQLLIASLEDKFGPYGKIGLALLECDEAAWTIKLLLMSCRVIHRGVGTVMISYIINQAKLRNVRLLAEFIPNEVNRMMNITYKFSGFRESVRKDGLVIFEHPLDQSQPYPDYIRLTLPA